MRSTVLLIGALATAGAAHAQTSARLDRAETFQLKRPVSVIRRIRAQERRRWWS